MYCVYDINIYVCIDMGSVYYLPSTSSFFPWKLWHPSHRHRLFRIIYQGGQGRAQGGFLAKKENPAKFAVVKKKIVLKEKRMKFSKKKKTSNQKWKSWVLQFNDDFVCMTRNPMITTQESRIIFFIVLVICW